MSFGIYGAYGYTGELVAREAAKRGLKPLLMGRREEALKPLAEELDLPYTAIGLHDDGLVGVLEPLDVVLHCAGPFFRTWEPMVDACLASHTHYLDVTGEIVVFEAIAAQGAKAAAAGVMLVPGVGFDVVPTDCLAKHLAELLPGATHLDLAILLLGGISHGTATTITAGLGEGGAVREGGRIKKVGNAHAVQDIDFGRGPVRCCTIPWGDVSTAFYSTGIPNIQVFASLPSSVITAMGLFGDFGVSVLGAPSVQKVLQGYIDRNIHGPDEAERASAKSVCWGQVRKGEEVRTARLEGPDGYSLTVMTALHAVERVEQGDVRPGFATPAKAWGSGFVTEIEGVTISEVESA